MTNALDAMSDVEDCRRRLAISTGTKLIAYAWTHGKRYVNDTFV